MKDFLEINKHKLGGPKSGAARCEHFPKINKRAPSYFGPKSMVCYTTHLWRIHGLPGSVHISFNKDLYLYLPKKWKFGKNIGQTLKLIWEPLRFLLKIRDPLSFCPKIWYPLKNTPGRYFPLIMSTPYKSLHPTPD